jgi:hypothetical protein
MISPSQAPGHRRCATRRQGQHSNLRGSSVAREGGVLSDNVSCGQKPLSRSYPA